MSESRWREIGSLFSLERSRYLSDHATSKPCNCRHFMLCGLFHWKGFFSVWITFSGFNIYRISCYVLKISSKLIMMKISSKLGFSFPHLLFPVPYESTVKFNLSSVRRPREILIYRWIKSTCFTRVSTMHCTYMHSRPSTGWFHESVSVKC